MLKFKQLGFITNSIINIMILLCTTFSIFANFPPTIFWIIVHGLIDTYKICCRNKGKGGCKQFTILQIFEYIRLVVTTLLFVGLNNLSTFSGRLPWLRLTTKITCHSEGCLSHV